MRTEILRRRFDGFGADLTAGTLKFLVGTAPGQEIKHIIFGFGVVGDGQTDLDLNWRLKHPEDNENSEAVLREDTLGVVSDYTPVIYSDPSGVIGYHRPLELEFYGTISDEAKALTELDFAIHFTARD